MKYLYVLAVLLIVVHVVSAQSVGVCAELCGNGCPRGQRCVSNGCGHECRPIRGKRSDAGICVEECSDDSDCGEDQSCFDNGCGHVCS